MITVIVPVYNTPQNFLKRAIDSLRMQGVEMEVLLIDDGSVSEVATYLDRLATETDEIKVFHKPNGGVSSARNTGLNKAKGDYVAFMDPDDELLPGYLSSALTFLKETGAAAVFGGMKYLYPDGRCKIDCQSFGESASYKIIESNDIRYLERSIFEKKALAEINFLPIQYVSNCSALFARNAIGPLRFREDIAISEDRIFNFEFLEHCDRVLLADGYWYIYHQNPKSASHSIRLSASQDLRATARAYSDLASAYDLSNAVRKSIDLGILECFSQAIHFCIFDRQFELHFGCSRSDYVSSLLKEPEYDAIFNRIEPSGIRWKILNFLCRVNAAKSIVCFMYVMRSLSALKKAITYKIDG